MTAARTVRLEPTGSTFTVGPGESILEAAERQGVRFKYGCRHGNCSACKYEVIDGDVDLGRASVYSLTESERDEGWALVCCATPLSDLVIADTTPPDPRARPLLPVTEHATAVTGVEAVGPNLWELRVARPEGLDFYAGQFVELALMDGEDPGEWRPYSLASSPGSDTLRFVIKSIPSGAFSGHLDAGWAGRPLALRGPFGDAYLRDGDHDVLLVATGSGVAPVLSILGDARERADGRRFRFFYGARDERSLAWTAELEGISARVDLDYVPCLTDPSGGWSGFRGRVTPAVQAGVGDASGLDAYVCGKPEMCGAVITLLEAKGLSEESSFADEFHPASDQSGSLASLS